MEAAYWIHDCETYCEDCKPKGSEPAFQPEADYPQHCAQCEQLLDCAMTSEGLAYVAEAVLDFAHNGKGRPEIISAWIERYPEAFDSVEPYEVRELLDTIIKLRMQPEGSV